jgi:hypothetical protein
MTSNLPFSQVLQSLGESDRKSVALSTVVAAVGTRVHGTALLLLALPEAVPLPIPSASSIIGFPLLMIAGHFALFGERSGLPARVEKLEIPTKVFRFLSWYLAPGLRRLERISYPRWPAIAERERIIGLVCALLSVILLLPIPFLNALPAMLLAWIAREVIQKDGIVISMGFAASVLLAASLLLFTVWLSQSEFSRSDSHATVLSVGPLVHAEFRPAGGAVAPP